MRKYLILLLAFAIFACKGETKDKIEAAGESVAEEVETAADNAADAVEDTMEKASEAVEDAAGEVEKAAEDVGDAVSRAIEKVQVRFDAGATSKTVEGSITGDEIVDYILNVREGQPMNISLGTRHTATYFNLMEPGEEYVAIFNGSVSENQFEGVAAKSGDYTIRVYMMRSAARRNEKADYRLEMIVGN